MERPQLTATDLKARLEEIFQIRHRSYRVAVFGTGDAGTVETTEGTFRIHPVVSELELRELLPDFDDEEERAVFLVPWTGSLPMDVGSSFVHGGRIFTLGRESRLRRLFGTHQIDDAASSSALARMLLLHAPRERYSFAGGLLTLDALWLTWLAEEWGLGRPASLSPASLLVWAATDDRGRLFRKDLPQPEADPVRDELLGWLERRLGPAAPAVWRAWEQGQGRDVLELALQLEALQESSDGAVRMWRTLHVKSLLDVKPEESEGVARGLAEAASAALLLFEVREGEAALRALLHAADAGVEEEEVRRALTTSLWLPSAWWHRLDLLGCVLQEGAEAPTAAKVARAASLLRELERHHLFKRAEGQTAFQRAEMAVRLLGWLVARPDRQAQGGMSSYSEAERLASWYAEEGGFVDRARRRARGSSERTFGEGVQAVVARVDALRTEQDRIFARALPEWLAAGKPSTVALPIESAVDHFVVRFLEGAEERRLLVLLLDGMAWAQAMEILESLQEHHWGPVRWNGSKSGGPRFYRPVLAALPTLTEVSRAAFFAGKVPPAGRPHPSEKDVDGWAGHNGLRRLLGSAEPPALLLRAQGHRSDGSATPAALDQVRDTSRQVVALVINAIDASLGGDPQAQLSWTVASIRSLNDLLDAARDAGRTVLLASDHGHVPGDRLRSVGMAVEARPRWRPWPTPDDVLAEYEVGLPRTLVWAPGMAHGIACLVDDEHCWGAIGSAGEHGGATLAEVVAPTVLIGHEGLAGLAATGEQVDADLVVRAPFVPGWWHFDLPGEQRVPEQTPAPESRPMVQTLLLGEPAPPAPHAPSPAASVRAASGRTARGPASAPRGEETPGGQPGHPLSRALARTELLLARGIAPERQARVLRAVAYLAGREAAQAPVSAFATAMETMPGRVAGLVSVLSEALNVDGFAVLEHDPVGQVVRLDVVKLKQLYGIS